MRVQRYQPKPRRNLLPWLVAGCLGFGIFGAIACGLTVFAVIHFAPGIVMQAVGFQPAGDTNSVFQADEFTPPPSNIVIQATVAPAEIVVDAGQFGQHELSELDSSGVQVALASSGPESLTSDSVVTTIDENGLLDVCRRYSMICNPGNEPIRNVTFDLRPGGVVINGDLLVPQTGTWQHAGIVMRIAEDYSLKVVGVDVNGTLFAAPPGDLGNIVTQAANSANDLLKQFAIETGGTRYSMSELYMDDNTLTAILR